MTKDEVISMLTVENEKQKERIHSLLKELCEARKEICDMAPYYVFSQAFLRKQGGNK